MRHALLAAAATAIVALAAPTYATTVNFDQGTDTASYSSQGLVLTGFSINSNTFGGAVDVPSSPNYAAVDVSGATISFVDIATGLATTSNGFGLTVAGLNQSGGYYAGATLTFFGTGGTTLGTQTFAPVGPSEFRSQILYQTGLAGIASVRFDRIENPQGPALFPIDDVSFNLNPVAAAVPEPATWGMMLLGFGLVGAAARRRRSVAVAA